jgi:hypothetical protein
MTSIDSKDSNDTINDTMAKSSKSTASVTMKKSIKKSNNKKTTGMEAIDLDTPPRKKPHATATASHYSVDMTLGFTVNPYAKGSKNKISIVLHEGGVPPNDAQPHVTLLPGGDDAEHPSSTPSFRPLPRKSGGTPPTSWGTLTPCSS